MTELKTAYVIEDNEASREFLEILMRRAGYQVTSFETADAALEHMGYADGTVSRNLPTVVITDNDTESTYAGVDVVRALDGTGVGAVMISANEAAREAVAAYGVESIAKPMVTEDYDMLPGMVQRAAEAAMRKKLGITGAGHDIAPGGVN